MGMVADVVLAVAVVAIAPGTVAELQFGVGYICPAANGAAVGVGGLRSCGLRGVGTCFGEGDHFGFFMAGWGGFLSDQALGVCLPGKRDNVQKILAKEQEVVG